MATAAMISALGRVLPALDLNFMSGPVDSRLTFTRSGTANYIDSTGNFESSPANTPRIDYTYVNAARRGLLVEESRTNLCLRTTLTAASLGTPGVYPIGWTSGSAGGSITADVINAIGCHQLTFSATSARQYMYQTITVGTSQVYMGSVYINSNSGLVFNQIFNITDVPVGASVLVYANGVAVAPGTYVPVAGDRLSARLSTSTTGGTCRLAIGVGVTGSATGTVSFVCPQFEVGESATSYIITTTTTASRVAEACYMTGASYDAWFTSAEGTLIGEGTCNAPSGENITRIVATLYDTASLTNSILIDKRQGTSRGIKTVAGSSQTMTSTWTVGTVGRRGLAYKNNDSATSFNAATPTSLTGGVPSGMIYLGVGSTHTAAAQLNGHVRRIRFYPMRLATNRLQTFSKVAS